MLPTVSGKSLGLPIIFFTRARRPIWLGIHFVLVPGLFFNLGSGRLYDPIGVLSFVDRTAERSSYRPQFPLRARDTSPPICRFTFLNAMSHFMHVVSDPLFPSS